jgi:hypothetical protein
MPLTGKGISAYFTPLKLMKKQVNLLMNGPKIYGKG